MSVIHKLPESLANKIAAGEVVQRPESVVKELVENALDAGATEIAVVTKNAGKSLILVSDNGSGMSEEDAQACFERHATSKISSQDDLDRIITLGFRGEALAAIASVAQVELKTRRESEELGTLVRVENGKILEVRKTACERGTSIAVRNLFFSVPARRKFLKSNATEFKHIAEIMQRFALCYPNVAFTLSDDDTLVIAVKGGTMEMRIRELYNEQMLNALLPYRIEGDGIEVEGFIGRPNFARKSRVDQYMFLNGRIIHSKTLSHAVFTGYEHLLDAQSYPPYILFLNVDPSRVDVNVHPTKAEVKFDDENTIYRLLLEGTRTTLSSYNLTPSMIMPHPQEETAEGVLAALRYAMPTHDRAEKFPSTSSASIERDPVMRSPRPQQEELHSQLSGRDLLDRLFGSPKSAAEEQQQPMVQQESVVHEEHTGLWQLHNKYIISQIRSGMMIIDQHVAHERILYEQALRTMDSEMPMSQQLLFPVQLQPAPAEVALVRELRGDLAALGFDLEVSTSGNVTIYGVPADVRAGQESSILHELMDQYEEYRTMGRTGQRDLIAASFGCRAAIKAGDPLSEAEMLSLIEQLFATSMPYVCPHGRPIVIRIDLHELDRRFGRTS